MTTPMVRRILITNDDGIDAPGLAILERIAGRLAEEVWVVAPEHDRSGAGQSISIHSPLRMYPKGERRYALSGTPADCVLFAEAQWFADTPPDLVLSGVNYGANISDSVPYSGTVGAVLTAQRLGIPAIALSQAYFGGAAIDWSAVEQHGEAVIRRLWQLRQSGCWNVNFPACRAEQIREARWCRQSRGSIQKTRLVAGEDARSLPYWWLGFERSSRHIVAADADATVLREQAIAITPLTAAQSLPDGGNRWLLSES
ncbi:5'/3'-nucleotidase SurE [Marinobacter sp. SS21]|uniref:5'/3'-nucleotidase SurE n=1 Tax=Marinobacter sp. SS21 TaxID=2979460 RepID=UPI00232D8F0B|nr:5'/3'-nucleotidase SurE [Marinobacter sp. SS21]MDC0661171.1 5'/3'-nucleotidase SurE [Marinobacter sp. SS21]